MESNSVIYIILIVIAAIVAYKVIQYFVKKKKKEDRINDLVEKYGEDIAELIVNEEIDVGMTLGMLLESWGQPAKVSDKIKGKGYTKMDLWYDSFEDKKGKQHYRYKISIANNEVVEIREF